MRPVSKFLYATLGFCLVIAAMTWYDLQPKIPVQSSPGEYYLIGADTPLQQVPENQMAVILWGGEIDANGALTTPGKEPTLFSQREVNLLFRMRVMPDEHAAAFDTIDKAVHAWEKAGNQISILYIDYAVDTPDWQALNSFLRALREHQRVSYRLDVIAKTTWFDDSRKTELGKLDMQKLVGMLNFDLDEAVSLDLSPSDYIATLEKIEFPYRLIVDESADLESIDSKATSNDKFFAGFIRALGGNN